MCFQGFCPRDAGLHAADTHPFTQGDFVDADSVAKIPEPDIIPGHGRQGDPVGESWRAGLCALSFCFIPSAKSSLTALRGTLAAGACTATLPCIDAISRVIRFGRRMVHEAGLSNGV